MQKQHNYPSLSFSSRLKAYIEKVERDYERTKFYKKHWHLVELIEDLEIFTVNRFTIVAKACDIKTTRRTVSTFFFYLHLDNFLEFTPVVTLMGSMAQIYNIDTIDPEKKMKAIKYYESINPKNQVHHDKKKNKQIQQFISSYDSSQAQSAGYTQARINRADAAETTAKEHNEPKLKSSRDYKKKKGYPERQRIAKQKKKQSSNKSKK